MTNPVDAKIQPNLDSRPVPDPTILTTQSIIREVDGLRDLFEIRFAAFDKAVALLQANADKSPTTAELNAQTAEKFRSIAVQFAERDTRTEQTSRDSKVAVDAALQAAKEAVSEQNKSSALAIGKSEASTTKQIDQIAILLQTAQKATDDKFSDMKERLTIVEGRILGGDRIEKRVGDHWGIIFGVVGMIVSVITGVLLIAKSIPVK